MKGIKMSERKNNQENQKQQGGLGYEQGRYEKRSQPEGRTTTTSQKPSPGHKK